MDILEESRVNRQMLNNDNDDFYSSACKCVIRFVFDLECSTFLAAVWFWCSWISSNVFYAHHRHKQQPHRSRRSALSAALNLISLELGMCFILKGSIRPYFDLQIMLHDTEIRHTWESTKLSWGFSRNIRSMLPTRTTNPFNFSRCRRRLIVFCTLPPPHSQQRHFPAMFNNPGWRWRWNIHFDDMLTLNDSNADN